MIQWTLDKFWLKYSRFFRKNQSFSVFLWLPEYANIRQVREILQAFAQDNYALSTCHWHLI
jgi:hypothetical protein